MRRARIFRFAMAMMAAGAMVVGALGQASGALSVTEAKYGFSFSLPAAWEQVPLKPAEIREFLRAAAKNDPSLKKQVSSEVEQATKEHLKFVAIGPVSGAFVPNMNIAIESSPLSSGAVSDAFISAISTEIRQELAGIGVHQLKVFQAKTRFGTGVEANYAFPVAEVPSGLVQGIQLYFFHGPHVYVVTFTATTQKEDLSAARAVEATWRWV